MVEIDLAVPEELLKVVVDLTEALEGEFRVREQHREVQVAVGTDRPRHGGSELQEQHHAVALADVAQAPGRLPHDQAGLYNRGIITQASRPHGEPIS